MLKKTADIPQRQRRFVEISLSRARFHNVDLTGSSLRGVILRDTEIDGDIDGLTVNGVEIAPLIRAELDRRHPEHKWLRCTNPTWLRRATDTIYAHWDETMAVATAMPEGDVVRSVSDEWSLCETLRHLVLVYD